MEKIGFIGVGIMGKPMAKNLINAGYNMIAYDIIEEALNEIVEYGADRTISAAGPTSTIPVAAKLARSSIPGAKAKTAARRSFSLFGAILPPAEPTKSSRPGRQPA